LTLVNLEHLALKIASRIGGLLVNLILPALRHLWIQFIRADDWSHHQFISFITPFSLQLQALHLYRPPISEDEIIECLKKLPSLVVLTLQDRTSGGCLRDRLLSLMTYGGSTYLCPRLEDLRLEAVSLCQDEFIADMVESRWRLEVPARYIAIELSSGTSVHSHTSLAATPSTSQYAIPSQLTRFGLSLSRDGKAVLYSRLDSLEREGLSLAYEKT